MILIVTNKTDYTADFLILGLKARGIQFARLNTEDFPAEIELSIKLDADGRVEGQLRLPYQTVNLSEVTSVWYRRPYPSVPAQGIEDPTAREFIVAESLETLEGLWRLLPALWISHPDKLRVAESKLYQLQLAARLGFSIPHTLITNSVSEAEDFYQTHSESVIYKPQRRSRLVRGEEVSLIYTNVVESRHLQFLDNVQFSPILLQPYIRKMLEIRATVVGEKVFAVELHSQEIPGAQHDWRRIEASQIPHEPHQLPSEVEKICIALVQAFGLKFSAIDLILTPERQYVFLEMNPNGQWAWIQQLRPDLKIREALIDLLTSEEGSIDTTQTGQNRTIS